MMKHQEASTGTTTHRTRNKSNTNDDQSTTIRDDDDDVKDSTDECIDLFTSTVRSLAADAACVREITSLAKLMNGVDVDGRADASILSMASSLDKRRPADDLDGDDNVEEMQQQQEQQQQKQQHYHYYRQELQTLDQLIGSIEQKVIALREIVNEENQALSLFESVLQDDANQQGKVIQHMMSLVDSYQTKYHNDDDNVKGVQNHHNHNAEERRKVLQPKQPTALQQGPTNQQSSSSDEKKSTFSKGDDNDHTEDVPSNSLEKHRDSRRHFHSHCQTNSHGRPFLRTRPDEISFALVTETELLDQNRNVPFGLRVTRYDLNDALQEIQQHILFKQKLSSLGNEDTKASNHRSVTYQSLQRRFDYLRQQQQQRGGGGSSSSGKGTMVNSTIETESHVGYWWVTEQELRENCAFFRLGESTARAILSLLCSLKRLKQVPGKNMEITYLWLS